jgi:hypothetical protein
MRLIINEQKIKRNKTIGNVLTIASLAILGAGLFFAFRPNLILWSYVALVVGFVMTQFSMYYSSRFSRSPRYDETMHTALETIRGDYSFYVHKTPVPYLLLGPNKLYALHPVVTPGMISYVNGKWKEKGRGIMMRIIGQESLGNPEKELAGQIQGLQDYLNNHDMPYTKQPRIEPLLVVLTDKTTLGVLDNPPIQIVDIKELKRIIRRFDREDPEGEMPESDLEQVKSILG